MIKSSLLIPTQYILWFCCWLLLPPTTKDVLLVLAHEEKAIWSGTISWVLRNACTEIDQGTQPGSPSQKRHKCCSAIQRLSPLCWDHVDSNHNSIICHSWSELLPIKQTIGIWQCPTNALNAFRENVFKSNSSRDFHIVAQTWDDEYHQDGDIQQERHQEVQEGAV